VFSQLAMAHAIIEPLTMNETKLLTLELLPCQTAVENVASYQPITKLSNTMSTLSLGQY
jgi:hypothetical protein